MPSFDALVLEGDALLMLDALDNAAVDLVLTDPPYSSGARRDAEKSSRGSMLRGKTWEDGWLASDELSSNGFATLLRAVAVVSYRIIKEGGFFAIWTDWRQLPNVMGLVESAGWRLMNLVVWDKGSFGLGQVFRNQHEFLVVASKGVARPNRRDVANVIRADRPDNEWHPTPKPVGLMAQIIDVLAPPNGLVVDPFAGSGSTGIAASQVGRRFLGFEISPEFTDLANARLAHTSLPLGIS